MSRSCTFKRGNSTKTSSIKIYGVFKRKKYADDI